MLKLTCLLKIDQYEIDAVVNIEVESSWENLTDTCKITFPNNIYFQGQKVDFANSEILRRGMAISVKTGYDGVVEEIFQGFITQVHATIPCKVDCEDAMWLLKQKTLSKSYRKVMLSTLLKDIINVVPYDVVADWDLGQFRIVKATPAKVIEELRTQYYLKSWFRAGILYCGLAYIAKLQKQHVFEFGTHIIDNSLEYRKKADIKIKVKGIIMLPNNKKIEIEAGDSDGDERTVHKYNISKAAMIAFCNEEAERLKHDGYRGSFTTFGIPKVNHGDIINIYDPQYPSRFDLNNGYLAKKVTTHFGTQGYRQEIELEAKANGKTKL